MQHERDMALNMSPHRGRDGSCLRVQRMGVLAPNLNLVSLTREGMVLV